MKSHITGCSSQLVALALPMLVIAALFAVPDVPSSQAATRHDIVVIVTDDQRGDTLRFMPLLNQLIGDVGVRFLNAFASTPLCCPSRASMLTGLYSHNHGVLNNGGVNGGAPKFDDASTIATWLQSAGYHTGLYGKYLNEYDDLVIQKGYPYVPAGWNEWHALRLDSGYDNYYGYFMVENGTTKYYGFEPESYSTNVLAAMAVEFIKNAPSGKPLFLYFAPFAPHSPATPAPGNEGSFSSLPPLRPPSYNEANVSDKPLLIRQQPLLTAEQQAEMDTLYRIMAESLQAVDRAVASIVDTLASTGRLSSTAIVYTSDNGVLLGEHRWRGKNVVYEESVRVPLLVRAPGVAPRTDAHLVLNIDVPVTVAEWAGIAVPTKVNGLSFTGLLTNPSIPWRGEILLEFLGLPGQQLSALKRKWQAVRTPEYVYSEYENGDKELYNLNADPYQLTNVVKRSRYAATVAQLKGKLDALRKQ